MYTTLQNIINQTQSNSEKFSANDLKAQRDLLEMLANQIDLEFKKIVKKLDGNSTYIDLEISVKQCFQYV